VRVAQIFDDEKENSKATKHHRSQSKRMRHNVFCSGSFSQRKLSY